MHTSLNFLLNRKSTQQSGFSLIELMVSLTVASLLSIAVVSAFSAQSTIYIKQAKRMQSNDDGRQSFELLSRLIRHANIGSFTIVTTDDVTLGKKIVANFRIPTGFPIWPNIDPNGNYDDNFVHLAWDEKGDYASQLRIANLDTNRAVLASDFNVLAGLNTGANTRISNFNLVEQTGALSYQLTVVARNGLANNNSETFFDGLIIPRN